MRGYCFVAVAVVLFVPISRKCEVLLYSHIHFMYLYLKFEQVILEKVLRSQSLQLQADAGVRIYTSASFLSEISVRSP